jgi:hypothetical protein
MKLHEVIPWGRSFEEYRRMFALTDEDLGGHVLGCGDGPASFNAEATALGHRVVSGDPIYAFSAREIERRVGKCYDTVISQVKRNPDGFVWGYFRNPDHLGECRLAAMRRFVADFEAGKQEARYVAASLPDLPFPDGKFSLAVVSHLLFLYSEHLDLAFHIAAFQELLRVAAEVRVFPLLGLDRQWSPHVGPVREYLERAGFEVEIVAIEYEFQRADDHTGNRMMQVRRSEGGDCGLSGEMRLVGCLPGGADEPGAHRHGGHHRLPGGHAGHTARSRPVRGRPAARDRRSAAVDVAGHFLRDR